MSDLERRLPFAVLASVRLLTLMALPIEGLIGYGDLPHFFNLAEYAAGGGGLPWIDHWVEFPPVFPYLSLGLHQLAAAQLHTYAYLMALILLGFDLGNLWLLGKLSDGAPYISWIYVGFLSVPAFGWWTFEPMAVFALLLAVWRVVEGKPARAGIAAGIGALIKAIPLVSLVAGWKAWPPGKAARATLAALGVVVLGLAPFFILSPDIARASLAAQGSKGSWETVWALIDGNLATGTFGPLSERSDPSTAYAPRGNPPVIPRWLPTIAAAAVGVMGFRRARSDSARNLFALVGLSLCLLFLWSPGWSPQWLAYLIPIALLALPVVRGSFLSLNLAMVSFLEWPVLLSRGRSDLLWLPVLLRTALLVLLAIEFWRSAVTANDV